MKRNQNLLAQLFEQEQYDKVDLKDPINKSESEWNQVLIAYERSFIPFESKIVEKIKNLFHTLHSQPFQLLVELDKLQDLISNPNISDKLELEKEMLYSMFMTHLKGLELELMNGQVKADIKCNTPTIVGSLLWARQKKSKLNEYSQILKTLSIDKEYQTLYNHVLESLECYQMDQFQDWISYWSPRLFKDSPAQLLLFQFKSGKLVVNYQDEFIELLRSNRQLLSLLLRNTIIIVFY